MRTNKFVKYRGEHKNARIHYIIILRKQFKVYSDLRYRQKFNSLTIKKLEQQKRFSPILGVLF